MFWLMDKKIFTVYAQEFCLFNMTYFDLLF